MCCLCCNAARQSMDKVFAQWSDTPGDTLLDRGRNALYQGKIHDALMLYSAVANRYYLEDASTEDQEQAVRAMNNLGYIYFYCYFDYQKAYSYLYQSQKISEEQNFESNLAYTYLNLGNLYYTLSNTQNTDKYFSQKPIAYYRKAFQMAVKTKKWDVLQVIYCNLLETAFADKKMKAIEAERKQFSQLHFPAKTVLVKFNHYMEKAMVACSDHRYHEALAYARRAKQAVDTNDTPERYLYSAIGMEIHLYSLLHDNQRAQQKLREMSRVIDRYNIKDLRVEYYKVQMKYYAETGAKDSSNYYELKYIKAKDDLMTESRLQMAGEMHFLSELQTANDRVRLLAAKHRQQQIIILLSIVLAIGAVTSALYFVRKNRELRRKQQALYEKMQESLHRESENRQAKYQNSNLDEQDKAHIFGKIQEVMADISVICSPEFSLRLLAEQVDTPYAKVSQVINEMSGKNFNVFLGECRVKEACRRLSDTARYGHLTIEAISASVGFKSRTNFVAMFKKVTGLTPSEYQRSAKLQNATKNT